MRGSICKKKNHKKSESFNKDLNMATILLMTSQDETTVQAARKSDHGPLEYRSGKTIELLGYMHIIFDVCVFISVSMTC